MRRVAGLLVVLSLSVSLKVLAAEPTELATLFSENRWSEALAVLEKTPSGSNLEEVALHAYHLGTVYLRLNRLGLAVAHLEKAHYLAPGNGDIGQNLSVARAALGRSIGESRLDPASTTLETLGDALRNPEALAAYSLLALAILALGWRLRSGMTVGFGILAWVALLTVKTIANSTPPAVMIERVPARSGPGTRFIEVNQPDVGSKVRLLGPLDSDSQGQKWLQIRFGLNSQIAWVPESSLVRLQN